MIRIRTTLLALSLLSLSANAAEFGTVLPGKSSLAFTSKQMGVPVDGHFDRFTTSISFNPASPAQASAKLEVELASIDAGSPEATDEVAGKPWFNLKGFPKASFVSSGVKVLGGGRYEAIGKLSIKGRSQVVTAPFTFREEAGNGVFDGSFTLKRLDFGLGEGVWTDLDTVANDIRIKFHVVASPRK
jgi:polyisoprenoid-binding protein YceI